MFNEMMLGCGGEQTQPPSDYLAFYKLDIDASDETGNYDGINNGVTFDGVSGSFDGVDDYIGVGSISGAKCISFWMTTPIKNSTAKGIFANYSTLTGLVMGEWTGAFTNETLVVWDFKKASGLCITDVFDNNDWKHVVVMHNSDSDWGIYVNNVKKTPTYFKGGAPSSVLNGASMAIGLVNSTNNIQGKFSNFRIYNRALTEQEITDIYNTELGEHS